MPRPATLSGPQPGHGRSPAPPLLTARPWRRGALDASWKLALIGLGALLAWRLSAVLLLVFYAVLIATVLRGLADAASRWLRLPPRLALALVTLALAVALLGAAWWIGPAVLGQLNDLFARLTGVMGTLRARYGGSPIASALLGGLSSAGGLQGELTGAAVTVARMTVGTVAATFAVVVVALYLAISPRLYREGAVSLVPIRHREVARATIEEIGHALRLWTLGQLVDMVTVGALAAVGLWLLGIPVPFALATLAGLLTIVPYFGALAAGVPGVLVALTVNWVMAVWVVAIFTICHVVEGYLVAPLVQRHLVRMPPALAILSMTIAAALFGPAGIIVGTPLAVAALVAVRRVYVEHILGDPAAAGDVIGATRQP